MARQREDLTGRKFNSLTVVSYNEEVSVQKKGAHWNCKCDCGNEKVIWGSDLKRGKTKSCGCCNKEKSGEVVKKVKKQREDLTGLRFGRLVVISYNEEVSKQKKRACWNCKCDCGNEKVIGAGSLKNGATTSCGCYQKQKLREMNEEWWKDEEYRRMKSESSSKRLKKKWQDEEFRQMKSDKMKEMWHDEEFRQAHYNAMKEKWQDEEYKQMKSDKMKEMWHDEEFRQAHYNTMKEKWQDEEYRQMQSERMREMNEEWWKDEEYRRTKSERMSGVNSPNWKGGITPIKEHLGKIPIVKQWFDDSKRQANYTCELTGKVGYKLNTHHLKAFSTIVLEAHELHNIQIKPRVKDYTEEELHKLEEYVASWHKDNSNAVVLSEEAHRLFHSLYGSGSNTPEQYEEFKQRYMAGEFEGLI